MRAVRLSLAAGLLAILVAGCGGITHPAGGRGVIDDQRTGQGAHLQCIQAAKLPVVKVGQTQLQVGQPPGGPLIDYQPTPGVAQGKQISGEVQSAEAIGSALLYPNQGSPKELSAIERCLAVGVKG